jgi:hypothetical protein
MDVVAYFGFLLVLVIWFGRGAWRITKQEHRLWIFAARTLVGLGIFLTVAGCLNSIYIEPTAASLRNAAWGHRQILLGALAFLAAFITECIRRSKPTSRPAKDVDGSQG